MATRNQEMLTAVRAASPCAEAARWLDAQPSARAAWASCERADWMLWAAWALRADRRLLVLAAVDCARTALVYAREEDLLVCLLALHIAEECANGREDGEWAEAAVYAVDAVDASPAWAARAAGHAAAAAAELELWTTEALAAAWAAREAAEVEAHKRMADLVRARLPWAAITAPCPG